VQFHELQSYLLDRGNFHDVEFAVLADDAGSTIALTFEDMDWNSEGFPDYTGPNPGEISFSHAIIEHNDLPTEPMPISEFSVSEDQGQMRAKLMTLDGGRLEFTFGAFALMSQKPSPSIIGQQS
jgi:hypothetical protein